MGYSALQRAAKLNIERKRRLRRHRVVSILAAIVVFCTTYALILPAITMEPTYFCGKEEHTHTDECYGYVTCETLICAPGLHSHDGECLDENGYVACGMADYFIHSHNSFCYNNDGKLICTLKEISEHIHTDNCYEAPSVPVTEAVIAEEPVTEIQNEASDGTEAITEEITEAPSAEPDSADSIGVVSEEAEGDSSSEGSRVLICTRELLCAHIHNIGCYDENERVICGSDELLVHNHTKKCIGEGEEKVLLCEKEEHKHDDILCVTNPDADIESAEDWEATLPSQRTGKLSADFMAVAKSQIGYTESDKNISADAAGKICGYTRYGAWYGTPHGAWNANFVNFCMYYTNEKTFAGLSSAGPEAMHLLWNSKELFVRSTEYSGSIGDLIFIDMNRNFSADFVGIVSGFDGSSPVAIFGDWENAVTETVINDSSIIMGFGLTSEIPEEGFGGSFFNDSTDTDEIKDEDSANDTNGKITVEGAGDTSSFDRLGDSGFYTYWEQFLTDDNSTPSKNTSNKSSGTFSLKSPVMMNSAPVIYGLDNPSSESSDVQIDEYGGTNSSADGLVHVSKTIAPTELENIFDITLTVDTQTNLEIFKTDPDMSIVIVMDISNTMRTNYGNVSRYEAAVVAAESFIDKFEANAPEGTNANLGFVAFNTSAHEIFELQECTTTSQATALKNEMRQDTGAIINASGYADSATRFTNIEAGLAMGYDMLQSVDSHNEFIIFLSDGFPTTYMKTGTTTYEGYDPNCTSGTPGRDGVFYDSVNKTYCLYGTSYSDKAAIRAHAKADEIKAQGAKIFSIGVDVGGQSLQTYINVGTGNNFSVVDRTGTTYDIGDPSSTDAFPNWLGNSIGSGYYYDSNNSDQLEAAFQQIFDEIKSLQIESTTSIWAAVDPLPIHNDDNKYIEFIHFYDKDGNPQESLSGTYSENGENSAVLESGTKDSIHWDLKESGYTTTVSGNTTHYKHSVTYRVRITNEAKDFTEGTIYDTNDITTLTYQNVVTTNDKPEYSEIRSIEFPIPAVHAYETEFSFDKIDHNSLKMEGIEFVLTHDTEKCNICHGDGTPTDITPYKAVSGRNGKVSFTDVASGHIYKLEETVPENFRTNGDTYTVTVSYDELLITVTHPDGTSEPWVNNTAVIENIPIYIPESQSLLITKDVNSLNGDEISDLLLDSAKFTFRVMASDAEGNAYDTFFLLPGTPYSIIQSGNTVGTGIVASDGTFTLKAGQTVLFSDLLTTGNGEYYVVEELISDKESGSIATVRYTVKAEEKTPDSSEYGVYTAYTTEAFDKHSTESLVFRNTIDTEKFGSFTVTKMLGSTGFSSDETFTMEVYIDSRPVAVGTVYTVGGETRTVTEEGIITLKANETAVFNELLPGTPYSVREIVGNSASDSDKTIVNAALYKDVAISSNGEEDSAYRITDGVKNNSNYYWEGGRSPSYFIVDLGAKYNLSYFRVYNYWKDGRSYDYNIYTSLDGSDYSLVYQQSSVKATSSGTRFNLSEEVTARYVKVEMPNGSTQNVYCHCVEFEAYGYIPDESTCMVTYSGTVSTGGTLNATANGVSGLVPADGSADITVTNTKYPFSVSFPIRKTALDNEGEKSFSFTIEQVQNNTWKKISDIGGTTITVTDSETGESFVNLGYSSGTTGTYYYKVSEIKGEDSFFYDENFYIVEVTAYDSYALITGVTKNGTEELTSEDISFVNTRKTALYVSKLVDSNDRTGEFSFSALITLDGEPVTLPEPPEDANYTVEGNIITFTLKDGEYVFIDNLPYGAKIKVEEILSEDNEFSVFYRIDGDEGGLISGSSVTLDLNDDTEHVHFINKAYYEIPATGGFGATPYTVTGTVLIISSFFALLYFRRKREVCCG